MPEGIPKQKQPKAMPALKRVNRHLGGMNMGEVDLDVTPIMNVFIGLIPFLMSMAVFTQVSVVEFSLPPAAVAGAAGSDTAMKSLDISIVITPEGFQIVGTGRKLDIIPKNRGHYQFDQLGELLKAIKFQYPSQKSVVLVLDSDVLYDDIIKFMDICRESQFPDIGLSGEIQ